MKYASISMARNSQNLFHYSPDTGLPSDARNTSVIPALRHVILDPLIKIIRWFCFAALLASSLAISYSVTWEPIPPEELSTTKPQVDPEAGAEILLREVAINDRIFHYHVRAKIYSDRGLNDFVKVEIPYKRGTQIWDVNVRTIKSDGSIIELSKTDIYDREIISVGAERVKVKSFSPAGLQSGALVEYTYKEFHEIPAPYLTLDFQGDLPARHVVFKYRPRARDIKALFFNCPPQPLVQDRTSAYSFEMRNVAAAKEEPFQPPALSSNASILIFPATEPVSPAIFWSEYGSDLHYRMKEEVVATPTVRNKLASIISDSDPDEQKLRKIYDYCRSKLINRGSANAGFTREQREKFKPNETATATLKAGHGTVEDINIVFVALACAAGFDARYAACNDRSFIPFNVRMTEYFETSDLIAAVKLDGKWQYFDPGVSYLPFAMPHWRNAGTATLIAAPKKAAPVIIEASPAEESQQKRTAVVRLDEHGTLEGDVTIEYTGHKDYFQKLAIDDKSAPERETYVREEISEYLKLAEISHIKIENITDPLKPLKISFRLRVPEYADRSGSRLFFQPAVFQKNEPARFLSPTRRTNLMFRYRSLDTDEITIAPPEGFELEEASAPGSFSLGEMGAYATTIQVTRKTDTITYRRNLTLRSLGISVEYYPLVKRAFENIHQRDAHTLTFRRKPTTTENVAPLSVKPSQPASTSP